MSSENDETETIRSRSRQENENDTSSRNGDASFDSNALEEFGEMQDVDDTFTTAKEGDSSRIEEELGAVLDRLDEPLEGTHTTNGHGSAFQGFRRFVERPLDADGEVKPPIKAMASLNLENGEEDLLASDRGLASPLGSTFSTPDDTASVQGSIMSSPSSNVGSNASYFHRSVSSNNRASMGLRPFDRRFSSRMTASPLASPRPQSPAWLRPHSRSSSIGSGILGDLDADGETTSAPWDVIRWTKLKKISAQLFSEAGIRNFGTPTCINIFSSIAIGTSKGLILVFDYHQTLKTIIGNNTKAVEAGPITSLAVAADYTTIAGGHMKGEIFTWEIAKNAKPFLHIPPIPLTQQEGRRLDGHVEGTAVLHLGFLGTRHTALVSADDKGMAFSHLASRSLVGRAVKTTRILGRYPFDIATNTRPRKPSAVLAFGPLPLGNAIQVTDSMGLAAMLTPYLLVIVSTTPIAQTQHKVARPKEVANETALSGCLAWFPATKLKPDTSSKQASEMKNARLAYCWSNIVMVLEISLMDPEGPIDPNKPPALQFTAKRRWKCDEAISGLQWLNRQVLAVLTVTQRLFVIEEPTMRTTEKFDLVQKEIFHQDFYSRQLRSLVGRMDEEGSLHASIADAFYNSFKTYKGRMFLLGVHDISVGALSNWADRLLALMEVGDFIGAIHLATDYYNGETDKITVGLPETDDIRHVLVQEKLVDMITASVRYAFGLTANSIPIQEGEQLLELSTACFAACLSMDMMDFFFDFVFDTYESGAAEGVFLETLEPHILDGTITSVPPGVIKSLISHYVSLGLESRLEEMLCHIDPQTMDIDQVTSLCKQNGLYDALIYVWNMALGDYITPMIELLTILKPMLMPKVNGESRENGDSDAESQDYSNALKIFPYLSYTWTGRTYPTGDTLAEKDANECKASLYYFLFLGRTITWPAKYGKPFLTRSTSESSEPSFPYLRALLEFDAPSLLSALNEAFEDPFLNDDKPPAEGEFGEDQIFGRNVNRQYLVSILLDVMSPENFGSHDTIYLDMFIARNLPKYPQYLLLSGSNLQKILVGLCHYPGPDIAEDCQLSVEYLLSVYHPPDVDELIKLCTAAGFHRVLKATFRAEKDYPRLLRTYFEDEESHDAVFDCIAECLRSSSELTVRQRQDVLEVIRSHASDLVNIDTMRSARIIDQYSPELHGSVLSSISTFPEKQFIYLRALIEPSHERRVRGDTKKPKILETSSFLELYIQHMCNYDPSHVADFIETLQTDDLNLEHVLPHLEASGAIDAVVHLLARDGRIREAMDKLIRHLDVLGSTLSGLLKGTLNSQRDEDEEAEASTSRAVDDTLIALHKFSLVGVWLCKGQMQTAASKPKSSKGKELARKANDTPLSFEETLWVDLIEVVVSVAKNSTSILNTFPKRPRKRPSTDSYSSSGPGTLSRASSFSHASSFSYHGTGRRKSDFDSLTLSVRKFVQDIFTALLAATTSTSAATTAQQPISGSMSFLRVFRAFLSRAAVTSPSLADLRNVLAGIFDAYMYEEQLLSISTKLLDKNLFTQVLDAAQLRQRGWKPQGQTCEACGLKVWGAGAKGGIYAAWEKRTAGPVKMTRRQSALAEEIEAASKGKGKVSEVQDVETENKEGDEEEGGNIVVFSCRHVFHQKCLERIKEGGHIGGDAEGEVVKEHFDHEEAYRLGRKTFECIICN